MWILAQDKLVNCQHAHTFHIRYDVDMGLPWIVESMFCDENEQVQRFSSQEEARTFLVQMREQMYTWLRAARTPFYPQMVAPVQESVAPKSDISPEQPS